MSDTVHFRGTLKEIVKLDNETLESQCERVLKELRYKPLEEYYDSHEEKLLDVCYQEYVTYRNALYSVEKSSVEQDQDIFIMNEDMDGVINFEVRYYNGGCSFYDAIDYAFENKI